MSPSEKNADLLATTTTPHLPTITVAPRPPKPPDALLIRKEVADYVTHDLGRPMSFSTLAKLCALGEGPPVQEWWGRFPLYRREDVKAWADARARKTRVAKPIVIQAEAVA